MATYDDRTEATWFTKYNLGSGEWFLESPCQLYKINEIGENIETFLNDYQTDLIDFGEMTKEDAKRYVGKYVKPMIRNGMMYEINNFQCAPYLPECVEEIKIISESECLDYLLNMK